MMWLIITKKRKGEDVQLNEKKKKEEKGKRDNKSSNRGQIAKLLNCQTSSQLVSEKEKGGGNLIFMTFWKQKEHQQSVLKLEKKQKVSGWE